MISCSFFLRRASISAMNESVFFCTSSSPRRASSWLMSLAFYCFLKASLASRRALRTATHACYV